MKLSVSKVPYVTTIFCLICVIIYLIVPFEAGVVVPYDVITSPWSFKALKGLFLASFVHADLNHITGNLFLISFLGFALERSIGSKSMLKLVGLSMVGSFVLFVGVNPYSMVGGGGASGVAFGLLVAYAMSY